MNKKYIMPLSLFVIILVLFLPLLIFGDIINSKLIEGKTQEEAINIIALETETNTTSIKEVKNEVDEIKEEIKEISSETKKIEKLPEEIKEVELTSNYKEMTEKELLEIDLSKIEESLQRTDLSELETKILTSQKKNIEFKIANPRWREEAKRKQLIADFISACTSDEVKCIEFSPNLKYSDLEFDKYINIYQEKLTEKQKILDSIEDTPENVNELYMAKAWVKNYADRIKTIEYVKSNLEAAEKACLI